MRLLSVFGTRPEAVKFAPILRALAAEPSIASRICVTAQHREMLDGVLGFFGILPDIDLDLMQADQSLNGLVARAIERLDAVLAEVAPDRVLVQGDTATAMAAAIAAHHRGIPVAHIEAGLRTYRHDPWPEETNRRVIALIGDLHFAPTPIAAAHLAQEHLRGEIIVTGNSGIDALHLVQARLAADPSLSAAAEAALLARPEDTKMILVTGHRREHFGAPFERFCAALRTLAARPDVAIVYPVHPNPRVRETVRAALAGFGNIHLIEPLDLASFVRAMEQSALLITDSGGVQEEAVTLGIPVLVTRDVTERPEGVAAGHARLVGTDPDCIVSAAKVWLDRAPVRTPSAIYGDGRAARRIVDALLGRPVEPFTPA